MPFFRYVGRADCPKCQGNGCYFSDGQPTPDGLGYTVRFLTCGCATLIEVECSPGAFVHWAERTLRKDTA